MKTKCKSCIFKNVENDIQIGCKLNVLDKLLSYNNIYSKENILHDENCFSISNFFCPYARTIEWKEAINNENIDSIVIHESHQKYYFIIVCNESNVHNTLIVIDLLFNMQLLPKKISIVYNGNNINDINILKTKCLEKIDPLHIYWKIHHILDSQTSSSQSIDLALETSLNNDTNMLCILSSDSSYTEEKFQTIFDIITFHLYKPVCVMSHTTEKNLDTLCIPQSLYIALSKKIDIVLEYLTKTDDNIITYNLTS